MRLTENWKQFWLLVLINAFVGAMIGLERSVLPGLAASEFHINGKTAVLSFIIAFGATKALFNLVTRCLMKRYSRKAVLILGWLAALPVPFLLMYAPAWTWILLANVLLGINQGLAWSTTVIMKIDLIGEKNRGLAMGINEFAGYLSVGLAAYLAAYLGGAAGSRVLSFAPGALFAVAGLVLSLLFVKDTGVLVHAEGLSSPIPRLRNIWKETTYKHSNLGSVTLNGLVNNLNDGITWGLLPFLLLQKGYTTGQVGILAGIYPAVWGIGQLLTGRLGDRFCKKQLIILGMWVQAIALALVAFQSSFTADVILVSMLGLGTALVYPNFLTTVAENLHPAQRAEGLAIFRFWRDAGYVIGALLAGVIADAFGIGAAFGAVSAITAGAGLVAQVRMCCSRKLLWTSVICP
ncbi:MFS transporter [Flaviaesturariibacter flavus]|uniref:MFS transporter n=1 Tax=Flaviaesturariibacter flavus TaxID=2502780 RepID=A0A4R1B6Y7_9BACT|nr:MFS transporter [Flaviaesturariibacter flavus]TCJ12148.1 MFS transporter [Flaviaesturariibacter flavus]